ncbi:CPBP family intramembrane glutamic endopeptidase [Paraglaciecola sp. L1A13]|uniref:CPBP family intramembrane glutamic endopeptidase n=1 Tax=Paraglaciecola sp. L1A13 TaxID=2686359 RepID=UPI00131ABC07|nr:type II CAAX endopeptidase family protein [Paraglaciecola sp. L1A13]
MENLVDKISSKKTNYLYIITFCVFAVLIYIRESKNFGHIFDFLPVLGGSIPYFFLTISLIFIYKSNGNYLGELGLSWPTFGSTKFRSLLFASLWALIIILIGLVSGSIVMESFDLIVGTVTDSSSRKSVLVGNLPLLLLLTPLMWLAVIGEELLFRGFIMNFLAKKFGGTTKSWILAIVVSSLIFGLAHFWQGARGIVGAGVLALIWGTAYYRCGRNLWPTIIAHSVGNTIAFISTYNS